MITPDYEPHAKLENVAVEFLGQLGYDIFQQTYHESFPRKVIELLQRNFSVASLYIRSRADRVAISQIRQFEFEIKTHFNPKYNDLTIELFPFLMHRNKRDFIDCIYICQVHKHEFGFWVSDPPAPKRIIVPPIPKNEKVKVFIDEHKRFFGNTPISYDRKMNGSNDPCVIFGHEQIKHLNHWQELLQKVTIP
jgi:hypothetical protein